MPYYNRSSSVHCDVPCGVRVVKIDCVFHFYKSADLLKQKSFIVTFTVRELVPVAGYTGPSYHVGLPAGRDLLDKSSSETPSGSGADRRWCFCLQNFREASQPW